MSETINAYPLQWPVGWKRTKSMYRKNGHFKTSRNGGDSPKRLSIFDGVERVLGELERMGVNRNDTVISTNVETRLDGLPRSDRGEPGDPGVAVYWRGKKGEPPKVMAIDAYERVADNLAAVAATLEAMRAIERHGGAVILERAFTGFLALPAPITAGMKRHWRDVLGLHDGALNGASGPGGRVTAEDVTRAYRAMVSNLNMAKATDDDDRKRRERELAEVNVAKDEAMAEVGS